MPLMRAPKLVEEVTQFLHMRLGGGVVNVGRAFGECRRHDGVLGGGDTGFVHQNFSAVQARRFGCIHELNLTSTPEFFESDQMQINAPPPDHVAAG